MRGSLLALLTAAPLLLTGSAYGQQPSQISGKVFNARHVATGELIEILALQSKECLGSHANPTLVDRCESLAHSEILRRKPISTLREIAQNGPPFDAAWSVRLLEQIGGPEPERILRKLSTGAEGYAAFEATMHFAAQCDTDALGRLNSINFGYGISSVALSGAAGLFGRCRFYQASSNLVAWIDAASLNLASAACKSLKQLYPDGPECRPTRESETAWRRRIDPRKR